MKTLLLAVAFLLLTAFQSPSSWTGTYQSAHSIMVWDNDFSQAHEVSEHIQVHLYQSKGVKHVSFSTPALDHDYSLSEETPGSGFSTYTGSEGNQQVRIRFCFEDEVLTSCGFLGTDYKFIILIVSENNL